MRELAEVGLTKVCNPASRARSTSTPAMSTELHQTASLLQRARYNHIPLGGYALQLLFRRSPQ